VYPVDHTVISRVALPMHNISLTCQPDLNFKMVKQPKTVHMAMGGAGGVSFVWELAEICQAGRFTLFSSTEQ